MVTDKAQRESFEQLKRDLDESDVVLREIGEIMGGFEESLEAIRAKVSIMYVSSRKDMKILDKKVAAQKKLSQFLNDIYFPENLAR